MRSKLLGYVLGLVPVGVALIAGPLIMPRTSEPDALPLPVVVEDELAKTVSRDRDRADDVKRVPLVDEARALGSALRDFHALEAKDAPAQELYEARRGIDGALQFALARGKTESLLALRAFLLEGFLIEVRKFVASGEESPELDALGGSFVRRMRREGWCVGHTLSMNERELRVFFKSMWNTLLGLEGSAEFQLTRDENRVLYAFYLTHPHLPESVRMKFEGARVDGEKSDSACAARARSELLALEAWRLERVQKLAALDPSYPAAYARGVLRHRRGEYGAAAEAFRDFLRDHPHGPWALRAATHLRAEILADNDR